MCAAQIKDSLPNFRLQNELFPQGTLHLQPNCVLAARRQEQRERSSGYLFLIIWIAMTLQYVQRSGDESIATPITATAT